jgi:hypothetical protein
VTVGSSRNPRTIMGPPCMTRKTPERSQFVPEPGTNAIS